MSAPGPLEEEARLLVEAARDWAARTFPADLHVATGSAECCWCPVCRTVAALRTPEAAERVAGAVTAAAGALATVLDALRTPPRPEPPVPADPADPPAAAGSAGAASAGPSAAAAGGPGDPPAGRSAEPGLVDIPVDRE